jgi:predicted DNA-binding mobile mystery protein A
MSQTTLGERLGIAQPSVARLEQAEATGGITIAKLGELAIALDCTLVYALVPNSSLEDTVMRQARRVAATRTSYVASTMSLEDQSVNPDQQADQLDEAARELVASGNVWSRSEKQSTLT